jgi:hypothetical protein
VTVATGTEVAPVADPPLQPARTAATAPTVSTLLMATSRVASCVRSLGREILGSDGGNDEGTRWLTVVPD